MEREMTSQDMMDEYGNPAEYAKEVARKAREAEAAERSKKWEEERKAQRAAYLAATQSIKDGITRALKALGHEAAWNFESWSAKVDGIEMYSMVDVSERQERGRGYYSSRKGSGTYNVTVGNYGNRTTFPPRKAGGHNYEKIAQHISAKVKGTQAAQATAKAREANKSAVDRTYELTQTESYSSVFSSTSDPTKPVRLKIDTWFLGTPEQVAEMVTYLRAKGLQIGYEKKVKAPEAPQSHLRLVSDEHSA